MTWLIIVSLIIITGGVAAFCVFFDQAVLVRQGTIYRVPTKEKRIALTFDDGPSPVWTPQILDVLKKTSVKATFFMIGHHVQKYPDIARRVVQEGHTIANHGYAHSVVLYYTPAEIEEEIKYTEYVIKQITGVTTKYYRPPKAWVRNSIKDTLKSIGYDIILWSLNSKDWVGFSHQSIVRYLSNHIQPGDIILFHDSGDVFSPEGGNRAETVKSVSLLAKILKDKGYQFATIEELLNGEELARATKT